MLPLSLSVGCVYKAMNGAHIIKGESNAKEEKEAIPIRDTPTTLVPLSG